MPNWVYNHLHIHATPEQIATIKADLSRPIVSYTTPDWKDLSTQVREVVEVVFSYMNILSPWDQGISEKEYFATHGSGPEGKTGDTAGNWYNWNRDNWGVKWDCDAEIDFDDPEHLSYRFDSPWGPPVPAIDALAKKYPWAMITLSYDEEQGWGGEIEWADGEGTVTEEYDIPMCHADYVARDQEYNCACAWGEPENFYEDCPPYVEGEAPRG
jgi:hypothetical protein